MGSGPVDQWGPSCPTRFLHPVLRPPAALPIRPKMFRFWAIGLLLPTLALARVLPSSHLNQLRGERDKDAAFIHEFNDFNELHDFNGFMDSDDSFESDESLEYGRSDSIESGESDSTTMLPISPPEETIPIFPTEEDQEMRFRYALSQILLPPPVKEEVEGSSKLKLPPAVQQEHASMLMEGETSFQPYGNLDEEDRLEEGDDFEMLEDLDELEYLEGTVDELPELAALEKYRGPNQLDLEDEENLEDYEDYQEEEDEDEDTREIVEDKWLSEDDGNEEEEEEDEAEEEPDQDEEDQDEEEEDEEENEEVEEDELDQDGEEEWLPELSAGV